MSILVIINTNCTNKSNHNTKIFSKYLKSQFRLDIPNEKHYYLIFPEFGCSGCIISNFLDIEKFSSCNSISIIVSNKELQKNYFQNDDILFDKNGTIEILNLGIGNIAIIETHDKIVDNVYNLTYNEKIIDLVRIDSLCLK